MSSRSSAGIQRQPQRSLSGTGALHRQSAAHRTLSPQYQTSTVPRKSTESHVDLSMGIDALGGHFAVPRLADSRPKPRNPTDSKKATASVESPQGIGLPIDPQPTLKPRGRPRLQFDAECFRSPTRAQPLPRPAPKTQSTDTKSSHTRIPMPRRPREGTLHPARMQRPIPGIVQKKDARPKPYTLEISPAAPHYPPDGHTDFFPWTGNHLEDQFSDHVIRQGYFDKSQTSQNETGSARLSLFPSLKHKSGLQTLSSLFTNVLAQRRAHGQITTPPTFKPPPRVTLTDTKRETWLRDLANPCISLRRLSRTIPHGIRGKGLLEQCLSKKIPTERAVWLAKCVGANEIRAFKRKSITGAFAMGGEAKWIRDWTVLVELFVESVIASCGEKDWKLRIHYAIRLAAHLYTEQLLDRDHYMDWLSSSLENCVLAKLPVWLLIVQIYLKDLLPYRKYGRRVVTALCAHLETVNLILAPSNELLTGEQANECPDRDIFLPLIDRIALLLRGLIPSCPENCVLPKVWAKCGKVLKSCLQLDTSLIYVNPFLFGLINSRNQYLVPVTPFTGTSPRRRLFKLLDTTLSQPFPAGLVKECWSLTSDHPMLVHSVLEWSTSLHRPGITKVFVGARLLRNWTRVGIDVSDAILSFVASDMCSSCFSRPILYHLVSELARSGHFSMLKYLQWLIARGGIRDEADLDSNGPCANRLLAELSAHDLPEQTKRLRRTVLSRASVSADMESQVLAAEVANMSLLLPYTLASSASAPRSSGWQGAGYNSGRISVLSRAVKSDLGLWARNIVSQRVNISVCSAEEAWKAEDLASQKPAIPPDEFNTIRAMLEDCEDIPILADILQLVSDTDDVQVLASATDTLNRHLNAFAAIGAMTDLFDKLLARLQSRISDHRADVSVLLAPLTALACRIPGADGACLQLTQELARRNRKTAADAYSPVSDQVVESLQSSEAGFSDEVEKVLASGTLMDKSTLGRLFQTIMNRLRASWFKLAQQQRVCSQLLSRLRDFDPKHFDGLMSSWLHTFITLSSRPILTLVLEPLISLGCVTFRDVLVSTTSVLGHATAAGTSSRLRAIASETLVLLLGPSPGNGVMTPEESYRLDIERRKVLKDFSKESLRVLRKAIEILAPTTGPEREQLLFTCQGSPMHELLQELALTDPVAIGQELMLPLTKNEHSEVHNIITYLLDNLLELDVSFEVTISLTSAARIERALQLADDLTLPFCQLKLQMVFALEHDGAPPDVGGAQSCLEIFENVVNNAVDTDNQAWISLVPTLDDQIARHLCQRAQRAFLHLLPSAKVLDSLTSFPDDDISLASQQLVVVAATVCSLPATQISQMGHQMLEKLADFWSIVAQPEIHQRLPVVRGALSLMLEFIKIHAKVLDFDKSSSGLRSRILLSLCALFLECRKHGNTTENDPLLTHIFDVAILLVDDLPEDARLYCSRLLKGKTNDANITYLFGCSPAPTEWLQTYQRGKLAPYPLRKWEILSEPTPNIGENDTSLSLTLFRARKL
ncbi:MAG: RNA polymerase II mediator complex subunit [Claussenomyces sp. TS43310]|nr:MAG: RNA polymerase II mediator complex subunit [Claussenomyces sp. TS43310]